MFCAETVQRAKAFSQGEGGAAPAQTVICNTAFCNKTNTEFTTSFVVPCRKRASDALPKSDGQQKDRFACPLPSHCRRRLMNPKHPLFLTFYSKITAITGSVPPSPREKASAQRPTIFSYGNAGHFRLYRIILDPVGANPRVRPTMLSCPTVFIKKTAASYPWATHRCAPTS